MDLFQSNLALFSIENPKGAVYVQSTGKGELQTCLSEREKNLKGNFGYYHDELSPLKEAEGWFSHLQLKRADVLYVFGIGLGYYYMAAIDWLKESEDRKIVFLEDDPAVIAHFLEGSIAERLLSHPRAHIYYFQNLDDGEVFDRLTWNFCGKQIHVAALKSYKKHRDNAFHLLEAKILYESAMKNDVVDEFLQGGAPFFKNFYLNLLQLPESYDAQALFGKFQGIPAIVCGAGPSLMKNAGQFRDLYDKALFFAGGSAMNAVNSVQFFPHFGAGIDPNPDQYERYKNNKAYETPFFYRNRLEHRAFRTIHGTRLYVKGAGGYPIADWFDEQLGIAGPAIDEGHNIVNFCADLAIRLGCDPIIFVGLDLAYTDMHSYSKGVVENPRVEKKQILEAERFELNARKTSDIYGSEAYTLWKWVAESEWLTKLSEKYPERTLINASEGGIGIEGVDNMPLEAAKKHLRGNWDLSDQVFSEIQNASLPVYLEQILRLLKRLKNSLIACRTHLDLLASQPDLGAKALAEFELQQEVGYTHLLEFFEQVYSRLHPEDEQGRCRFLSDTARLNLDLIESCVESRGTYG